MAETAPEFVATQRVVPNPLLDRGGSRCIHYAHGCDREHYCLPKRAIAVDLYRVGCEAPCEPSVRIDRSFSKRHRRDLFNAAVSDRSRHLVVRGEELASQPERELGGAVSAHQLGSAQRARILGFPLCSVMGNLRDLFFLPTMVYGPAPSGSRGPGY